jgi:hypothetical protein
MSMSKHLIALMALLPLASGCAEHSKAWDDAWAQCENEAIEQMEIAHPDPDQRATWQENYIRECMQKKGFKQ